MRLMEKISEKHELKSKDASGLENEKTHQFP